jgi:ectoine hydroxylase-related dioxygenase (phytanoyl-CoA dioxygenase family)
MSFRRRPTIGGQSATAIERMISAPFLQKFASSVDAYGWATTPRIVDATTVAELRAELAVFAIEGRGGARNLLENAKVRALATVPAIRSLAASVLGSSCFAVRALLFDKTPAANWKVVWHQDLTIATRERQEVPGFGPWTEKAEVPHVQPPVRILEQMLAVRLHLDPCHADNGPVRVIDGSHRRGRLSGADIERLRQEHQERDCLVDEGGVLGFRPLLLHASAPAKAPSHRRVIHIEFSAAELPLPLSWHARVR